jgi:uncharacterized cupin superfamily protein
MPKIDIDSIEPVAGTGYPADYAGTVAGRSRKRLGDAGALTQFGVNLTILKPGAASALRHRHQHEDEFVYVLSGALVLVEDTGETLLTAGDAAAFPAATGIGHHLLNRSESDAVLLEIGTRADRETVDYTDPAVDLKAVKDERGWRYLRRDGSPW